MYFITISTSFKKKDVGRTVAVSETREMVEMLKERLLAAYKTHGAKVTDYRRDSFEVSFGKKICQVCIGMVTNEDDFNGAIKL